MGFGIGAGGFLSHVLQFKRVRKDLRIAFIGSLQFYIFDKLAGQPDAERRAIEEMKAVARAFGSDAKLDDGEWLAFSKEGYAHEFLSRLGFEAASFDIAASATHPVDFNDESAAQLIDGRFDLVINLGTSEHVANQVAMMRFIHEITAANGLMVHGVPLINRFSHSILNYSPRFFESLRARNGYLGPITVTVGDEIEVFDEKLAMYLKDKTYADLKVPLVSIICFFIKPEMQGGDRPFEPPLDF